MQCPYCQEEIQDGAIKCKHCQSMLTGSSEAKPTSGRFHLIGKWLMIGIFILSIFSFFYKNFSITLPIVGEIGASMYDVVKMADRSSASGDIKSEKPALKDVVSGMHKEASSHGGINIPFIVMAISVFCLALHYLFTIVWGICTFALRRSFRTLNIAWLALAVQFPIIFAIGGKVFISDLKNEMLKKGGANDPFAALGAAMVSTFSIDPGIIMWILMSVSIVAIAIHFIGKNSGILNAGSETSGINETSSAPASQWTKPAMIIGAVLVGSILLFIVLFSGNDQKNNKAVTDVQKTQQRASQEAATTAPALPSSTSVFSSSDLEYLKTHAGELYPEGYKIIEKPLRDLAGGNYDLVRTNLTVSSDRLEGNIVVWEGNAPHCGGTENAIVAVNVGDGSLSYAVLSVSEAAGGVLMDTTLGDVDKAPRQVMEWRYARAK